MSSDASEENRIEQNNNGVVYWWKTHKDTESKRKFCWAYFFVFIPTRRVFIVGQLSKENEICTFTLFFLICLLTNLRLHLPKPFPASRPHVVSPGQMCPNRSKIVAKTGLMVPTRAWTCKEANTFCIFQFCLVRNLFMRVRNYDNYFRRHSSLIPRLTLAEPNEVAAQGQCGLISVVGDFHMIATGNGKCQGNTTLIRSRKSPSLSNKPNFDWVFSVSLLIE